MTARCKPSPVGLQVTFERDGEASETLVASSGRQALAQAFGLLITRRELRSGDKLTVTATADDHE